MPCPCLTNLTNILPRNHHRLAIQVCTWAPNSSLCKWIMEFGCGAWVPQNTWRKLSLIARITWNWIMTAGMSCWLMLLIPLLWDKSLNLMRHLFLDPDWASYYQSIIRTMKWMCKIGRIDIATEVLLLSSHLAYPLEGHLDAALNMMGYLRLKYNSWLIFDPTYLHIDDSTFQRHDWEEFYGDVQEALLTNAPPHFGKEEDLCMMASDHAGDKLTRLLQTGFLIFLNILLIN